MPSTELLVQWSVVVRARAVGSRPSFAPSCVPWANHFNFSEFQFHHLKIAWVIPTLQDQRRSCTKRACHPAWYIVGARWLFTCQWRRLYMWLMLWSIIDWGKGPVCEQLEGLYSWVGAWYIVVWIRVCWGFWGGVARRPACLEQRVCVREKGWGA